MLKFLRLKVARGLRGTRCGRRAPVTRHLLCFRLLSWVVTQTSSRFFLALTVVAYLLTYITTIVLVCRWFHLAVRRGLARGGQLGITPAGAVGTWFIPFVNFVKPFDVTRQLLVTAGKSYERVGPWQATWVVGNIIANVGNRLPDEGGLIVTLAANVLLVVAAVLGAKSIDELRFE